MAATQVLLQQPLEALLEVPLENTPLDGLLEETPLEEPPEKTLFDVPVEELLDLPYEELLKLPVDPSRLYVSPGLYGQFKKAGIELNTELVTTTEPYVDADYEFDPNKFQAQNAEVLKRTDLEKHLPWNFPEKVDGPLCWSRATGPLPKEKDYVFELDGNDLIEIKGALKHFKSTHPQISS